ncbi:MAG: APA family fibronectin-binding glycoprotein, partial [Mycobacterium sp.]|nr:APA family fibronectin-binding glycoprotein [Mycobacterium sp.]
MDQVDPNSTRRRALWAMLATGASVVTIAMPATAGADPEPAPPPPATTAAAPPGMPPVARAPDAQPGPVDPGAPPPDPNAPVPPPVVDPNAGRITNAVGGFSYVLPTGW